MLETLHCLDGHDWKRERSRGRKPVWCPEHRPTGDSKPVSRPSTPKTAPKSSDGPNLVKGPQNRSDVAFLLENEMIDPEWKRKMRYVERELDAGREQADINLLSNTRKGLLKEAARMGRVVIPEEMINE